MIAILPETHWDLLAVQVSAKLTDQDFDTYRSLIRQKMEEYGSARLYFEMVNFEGWQPGSFVENGVFDLVHGQEYGRVAMVGEKQWQRWAARLAAPVKKEGIKYFDLSDREKAMAWVLAEGEPLQAKV
jgi:hypothetical protein